MSEAGIQKLNAHKIEYFWKSSEPVVWACWNQPHKYLGVSLYFYPQYLLSFFDNGVGIEGFGHVGICPDF
jgi:hypothetical protein